MRSDPRAETRAMHACDTLFGKIMHVTSECCDKCGSRENVQVAHIIRRRFWYLRCAERNVRMLCERHHRTVDAGEWSWEELIGIEEWDRLVQIARNEGKKPHDWWRQELRRLRSLARSVGVQA